MCKDCWFATMLKRKLYTASTDFAPEKSRKCTYLTEERVSEEDHREKSRNSQNDKVPYLNKDIIFNIFTRIPCFLLHKELKHQCKEWYNIISNPYFETTNFPSQTGVLVTITNYGDTDTKLGYLELIGLEFKLHEFMTFNTPLQVISACRGLLLVETLTRCSSIFVLNPLKNEKDKIPPCRHNCVLHELVFIPSMNKYKVVHVFYAKYVSYEALQFRVTSTTCSEEDDSYYGDAGITGANGVWKSTNRVFIDGALYMNCYPFEQAIVFLDICNKSSQILGIPNEEMSFQLTEFCGSLSLLASDLTMWVLKNRDMYNAEWEKKFVIKDRFFDSPSIWRGILGSLSDGQVIVFANGRKVYAYDIKTRRRKETYVGGGDRVHVNNMISIM